MSKPLNKDIERARNLRIDGNLNAAIEEINNLLSANPNDPDIVAEAIKISLLAGQMDAVRAFCVQLASSKNLGKLDNHIVLRIKTILPDFIEGTHSRYDIKWAEEYRKNGNDPVYKTRLLGFNITCHVESAIFHFQCECESCGTKYTIPLRDTFIMDKEYFCPECFAKHHIDYDMIKMFVESKYDGDEREKFAQIDSKIIDLRQRLNRDAILGNEFPLIPRYLNHDYAVLLNSCLLSALNADSRSE